jgi:uncharacterized protein (TIGR00645 family)
MSAPQPIPAESVPQRKTGLVEQFFEKVLWQTRFLVLLAVIPSIIGAVVLFVIGGMDIFKVVSGTWRYVTGSNPVDIHETVVTGIVGAVDIYLIAIVLLIFGLGTYKLFISRIEPEEGSELTHLLNVTSIDELKDKIARVVILAVIIEFFRAVVNIRFDTPLSAIYLAGSVLALSVAILLMKWTQKP